MTDTPAIHPKYADWIARGLLNTSGKCTYVPDEDDDAVYAADNRGRMLCKHWEPSNAHRPDCGRPGEPLE